MRQELLHTTLLDAAQPKDADCYAPTKLQHNKNALHAFCLELIYRSIAILQMDTSAGMAQLAQDVSEG